MIRQVSFSQEMNKKTDLLIGKWQMFTYTTIRDGKFEISYNGYFTHFYEFNKDGSFISTSYQADSLISTMLGKWELNALDTLRYFEMALVPHLENVIPVLFSEKLISVNDTSLIVSNGIFVERSSYNYVERRSSPKKKREIPKTYFRRIE